MKQVEQVSDQVREDDSVPAVIVLDNAATLTQGGQGTSTEDKRYQYG
ncbi:hypothetical protein MOV08_20975 [Streptomyces yunnanensis]|uniref:Uncharacterized protein n=1 Tax=Streptomyces yunnanensis TaxID=156453 RepID=A0ABY8A938_9ACTN|nr:hypothetical protein [Streptomyces yunnanensis]WEB41497.1 hypothetical protein MOV08_20975 [Streptomyces yunnanensis]